MLDQWYYQLVLQKVVQVEEDQLLVQVLHNQQVGQEILRQFHHLKVKMVALDIVEVVMVKVVVVELL